jgi:hypothetical protein
VKWFGGRPQSKFFRLRTFLPCRAVQSPSVFNSLGLAQGVQPKRSDREGRAEDPLKGIEGWAGSFFPFIFRRLPTTTPK